MPVVVSGARSEAARPLAETATSARPANPFNGAQRGNPSPAYTCSLDSVLGI
jgi:hypothetical protein